MEGKFTKIGTIIAVITLFITLWQIKQNSVPKLEGNWIMKSQIKDAKMSTYIGMNIEWVLHLSQNGKNLQGNAVKTDVNGNKLSFSDRTSLDLKGSISGKDFTIHYIENGKQRKTSGIFHGHIDGNTFKGTFSQTASDSKGTIYGERK